MTPLLIDAIKIRGRNGEKTISTIVSP